MAYLDPYNSYNRQESIRKFDELKLFLKSKDNNGKLNEYLLALFYIEEMEKTIQEQKEEINRYTSFFRTLSSFLPKQFSRNDIIY